MKKKTEMSEEEKQLYEQRDFLATVAKPSKQQAVESRKRYDYEWMVRDLFRRGYHFSRYQPSTNTIILASRSTARVPVNLLAAQMRSIRNQVTSFRPKFEVLPRYGTIESQNQARYSGRLLDYFYDHLKMKDLIKKTITQGLMFSVGGPWQIYYDEDKKEVRVWLVDTYDFFIDPLAESLEDAEYCIKCVRRPLEEIWKNPDYRKESRKEIGGGESRLAQSEYKQFLIQTLKSVNQYDAEEHKTIILNEGSFKVRDKETGKVHIRNVIWTDQNTTPLYWEDTDSDEYDYVLYHADLNPKEIYGEGWMRNVMPINRVINSLESSVYEYNYRVAKGRIVVDRDSGVRAIHNVHGEIVAKNKGAEVRALDMPPLPVATQNQIERMGRYIEDIGGAHDASLGRVPAGVKSGIGVAELKQADSTNQDDLVDNLEDFMVEVARKMLKKVSKHYKTYQAVHALGFREEDAKYFAIVGSHAKKKGNIDKENKVKIGPDWVDLAIIGDDNNVRVTIGSWLGYTKEMMQEKVLKLAQAGLIDQKTFLQLWEFGSIDMIVQQTRVETLLKRNIENPSQPGVNPGEADQYGLAMTENEMMVFENKNAVVDSKDDHMVHIALHQEALGRGNDDIVRIHIAKHQIYLGQGPQEEEQEMPPQGMEGVAPGDMGQMPPPPGGAGPQTGIPGNVPAIAEPGTNRNPMGFGGMGNPKGDMGGALL